MERVVTKSEFHSSFTLSQHYSSLNNGRYEMHLLSDTQNRTMCRYIWQNVVEIENLLVLRKLTLFPQTHISRLFIPHKKLSGHCINADLLNKCMLHCYQMMSLQQQTVDAVCKKSHR